MFLEYKPIRGPLLKSRVNSLIGSLFLGTCALWAATFIWDITTGDNPITHAIVATVGAETSFK